VKLRSLTQYLGVSDSRTTVSVESYVDDIKPLSEHSEVTRSIKSTIFWKHTLVILKEQTEMHQHTQHNIVNILFIQCFHI